jgi:hypothetical protein
VCAPAGGALVPELQLRDDLVGEGAGHHKRGVAGGTAKVEQAALSQHNHAVAVREDEPVDLGLDVLALDAWGMWSTGRIDTGQKGGRRRRRI